MYLGHIIEQNLILHGRQAVRNQSQTLSSKGMHVCAHSHPHTHKGKSIDVTNSLL